MAPPAEDDASAGEASWQHGWHGAFDALSEQLQLPPLMLRASFDAKHREMVRWRDLARALAQELERDELARDEREAAAPPDAPGP
jgi:uncharacterized membrane protein YccC